MLRAIALILAALTLGPLQTLGPIGPAPRDGPAGDAGAPEGCALTAGVWICGWEFRSGPAVGPGFGGHAFEFEIPVFPRNLATLTMYFEGENNGWTYYFYEMTGEGREAEYAYLSGSYHLGERALERDQSAANYTRRVFREETAHWFETKPDARYFFYIWTEADDGVMSATGTARNSDGTFRITYLAEALPDGRVPARPAATRDDPQVLDGVGDSADDAYDVTAFWFDDARVGDGVFDARLAVRDLSALDMTGVRFAVWFATFRAVDHDYFLRWGTYVNATGVVIWYCQVGDFRGDGFVNILGNPRCAYDLDNSTFSAAVPERAVGSPADGSLFERMGVVTYRVPTGAIIDVDAALRDDSTYLMDDTSGQRYAFALGGEEVWDALNPRLAIPPPTPLPWYRDPLASENVPDTLQVAGATTASVTFFGGALLVRRRNRATRRLLDEVDHVVAEHERDAHAGLLALGRLETRFNEMHRRGQIGDSQYHLAAARIASAARRLAMRRDLGLDDGAPGVGPRART